MRLFIASPVILENYAAIKNNFKDIIEGKWTDEKKLHLTWIFLSEHPTYTDTVEKMKPLTALETGVEVLELGYFGTPPRVLYAKAEQKALYDKAKEFKKAGFDLYRFKPHVTLCRIKQIHDYKAYKEKMKEYKEKPLGLILPKIVLYESKHKSRGIEYQSLFEIQT